MASTPNFWQRIGIQDWFLTNESTEKAKAKALTPDTVYSYIVDKFRGSIKDLSFADRVVFYHEFIISFNAEDYREFVADKQGIFGLIVQETVTKFYEILKEYRAAGKTVKPSGSKWVFRLVSHPDYARGDKGFIGKLLPDNNQKEQNLRVTFIPRQTGIAQTFDVSQEALKGFTYYSEGYFEIPYEEELEPQEEKAAKVQSQIARLETIIPDQQFAGKKVEYLMKDEEIIISGSEETREGSNIFTIPSDWVNAPHLQIKYNKADGKFYLASFGEITTLNEVVIERSDINAPKWVELPINSRMLLNGIIGLNLFKA
ncbi:hypothetical protein [Mucilaginibacter phyllosphaerae]|uniref:FHA domain-containing protein n=1 Tax=Mucilaginibacter phyllosphaerae TaxID=1812349 RepID=A0A4Y8AIR8_9SPHI|nr:hypothetical protein [Mucilaginibacter phyllosphaerae]MBB3968018.1 hypothetical protein [Mucilaginibacter phyllosphaerae]TEW68957.1 hypothetical protein E2R65_01980 [Mucilaginibacter phyllosphaerae]GGH01765.1 hypothetical protein GCM10007352_03700 [Mucilaginibacter phyllosphaerae]